MFTRFRRAAVLAICLALVAAACGGDDDDDAGSGADIAEEADPNGVLRWGFDFQSGIAAPFSLDPATVAFAGQEVIVAIYDTLLHRQPDGSYEPGLAESAEITAPDAIEVKLRSGVTFTDGTPFDAQAVKVGLERNAARRVAGFRPEMSQLASVEIVDDLTVVLRLKAPVAGLFYALLGDAESAIPSPAAISSGVDLSTAPVGAGPFKVESYAREALIELVKNDDWYAADELRLAGLEFHHVAPGAATVNAVRSGAIDFTIGLTAEEAQGLTDPWVADIEPSTYFYWLRVCTDQRGGPWADARVRQALNYAVDREALNEVVFGGAGEPAGGSWWPEGHPFASDDQADRFTEDLDRARRLLAEAGYPDGFQTSTYVAPGESEKLGTVLQAQLARVGVRLELLTSANLNTDFFQQARSPGYIYNQARPGLDKVTSGLSTGAFGNVCNYQNPEAFRFVDQARLLPPGDPKLPGLWDDIQRSLNDDPAGVYLVFGPQATVHDGDRLGGVEYVTTQVARKRLDLTSVYVKR